MKEIALSQQKEVKKEIFAIISEKDQSQMSKAEIR
jgi:hypothetical protein